jgi:hypothetical protein
VSLQVLVELPSQDSRVQVFLDLNNARAGLRQDLSALRRISAACSLLRYGMRSTAARATLQECDGASRCLQIATKWPQVGHIHGNRSLEAVISSSASGGRRCSTPGDGSEVVAKPAKQTRLLSEFLECLDELLSIDADLRPRRGHRSGPDQRGHLVVRVTHRPAFYERLFDHRNSAVCNHHGSAAGRLESALSALRSTLRRGPVASRTLV